MPLKPKYKQKENEQKKAVRLMKKNDMIIKIQMCRVLVICLIFSLIPVPYTNAGAAVNHAPAASNVSVKFPDISEDIDANSDNGITVAKLLELAGAADDDGDALSIAITSVNDSDGRWELYFGNAWYSLTRYKTSTAVTDANVYLVPDGCSIRFLPGSDFNGEAYFTFRVWDGTTGTADNRDGDAAIDTSGSNHGGSTAFSSETVTAAISVASVNDAPELHRTGLNNVLNFDGSNDFVSLPDLGLSNGSFTVEGWIKADRVTTFGRFFDFGSGEGDSGGHNILVDFDGATNYLNFEIWNGANRDTFVCIKSGINAFPINKWVYLSAVYDNTGHKGYMYWNGKQVASGSVASAAGAITRINNYFGRSNWAADQYFDGKMRGMAVFKEARTADEVARDMNTDFAGTEDNLVLYYPLKDAVGSTTIKSATNQYDGSLYNYSANETVENSKLNPDMISNDDDFDYQVSGFAGASIPVDQMYIKDVDAGNDGVTLSLHAANGGKLALALNSSSGVTVSGNNTASLTLSGTVNDINTALKTFTYKSSIAQTDTITCNVNDHGSLSDNKPVYVTVISPDNATTPSITVQPPSSVTAVPGQKVDLSVTVTGPANGSSYTCQWQESRDGGITWSDISGALGTQYTIISVEKSQNGYQYRCYVYDASDNTSVTSDKATVTVVYPVLKTITPANKATGIAINTKLNLAINENVTAGTGKISIADYTGRTVYQVSAADSSYVSINNNAVAITLPDNLEYSTKYHILIDPDAFKDGYNSVYEGISDSTTWSFATAAALDTTAPVLKSHSPADNAAAVEAETQLKLTFSENINAGSGYISVRRSSDASLVQKIPVQGSSVGISSNTVTVTMPDSLDYGTNFYVTIDADAFKDICGNSYEGLSDETAWNFTTAVCVASVTTGGGQITYYSSLQAAIDYAEGNKGSILKLLENVDINDTLDISQAGAEFILDLNGKMITGSLSPEDNHEKGIVDISSGSLTLVDIAGNGLIKNTYNVLNSEGNAAGSGIVLSGGTLNLMLGTIEGCGQAIYVDTAGSSLNISGGVVYGYGSGSKSEAIAINDLEAAEMASITILGGYLGRYSSSSNLIWCVGNPDNVDWSVTGGCYDLVEDELPDFQNYVRLGADYIFKNISESLMLEGVGHQFYHALVYAPYRIMITNDGNGTAGASAVNAGTGDEITLTATPNAGFHFKEWQVTEPLSGLSIGEDNKFVMPAQNVTVKAIFEKTNYSVTVTNDGNGTGSASPASAVMGEEVTLTAAPNAGYHLKEWQVTEPASGLSINADNKFTMPVENVTVKAIFEKIIYAITVTNDGNGAGSASPLSAVMGDKITLTATPDIGYHFKEWQVTSPSSVLSIGEDNKFTMPAQNVTVKAIFEKINYNITATNDGNGTGSASPLSAVMGEEVTLTATPNAGYHFKEWQVTEPSSGLSVSEDNKFIMPAQNVTVKAIFEKTNYSITVKSDGNGTGSANPLSAVMGEEVTLTATPNAGYHFKEWQVTESSSGLSVSEDNKFIMPAQNVTVKAIFEKTNYSITVKSDGNGTGSANPLSAVMGEEVTLTATPNAGYHLKEWQVTEPSSGLSIGEDNKFTMPAQNVTVKAIFEKISYSITVINDGNGTGSASPFSAVMGEEVTLTATPNTGYHFKEWQVTEPSSGFIIGEDNKFTMSAQDVTVKAVFEKTSYSITVTNDGNGTGSASPLSAVMGDKITLTATPDIGYHFKEWQVTSPSSVLSIGEDNKFTMPAQNVTVKAIFEKINYNITVTNDGNGTGSASPTSAVMGEEVTLAVTPNAGYHFKEWQVTEPSSGLSVSEDNKFIMPAQNVTVKAIFEKTNYSITVTNDGNGTGNASPASAIMGEEVTLTVTPNAGYHFQEWQVTNPSSGLSISEDNKFIMPAQNVTVKAIFEKTNYSITVTNDGNGTGNASSLSAVMGEEVTLTATPNAGYHLKGWQVTEPSSGLSLDENNKFTMPAQDVIVKAIFEKTSYSITLTNDGNGTGSASPLSAVMGEEVILTETPNAGYHFKEWQVTDPSSGLSISEDNKFIMPAQNITVKAIFEKANYGITVTNDGNGTGSASSLSAVIGEEVTLTATPNVGYHFKEWQVTEPSSGLSVSEDNKFIMPAQNVTVKAIFERTNYSITVTNDGNGTGSASPLSAVMGEEVTLTATPNAGYHLKEWQVTEPSSGLSVSEDNKFTMPAQDVTVKAIFEKTSYSITVTNDGNGTGSASPLSAVMGEEVTLTATPNPGYHFKEWQVTEPSSGLSVSEDNKFIMPAQNVTVKAIFEKTNYSITVINNGNGTGSASPTSAVMGEEVTLAVTPNAGYHFKEWQVTEPSSGLSVSEDNKFIMPAQNVMVKAIFEKTSYSITVTNDGNGTGSASPASAVMGEEVTLTATPNAGYHLKEWQVTEPSSSLSVDENNKFTMPAQDVTVKAIFEKTSYSITVTNDGNGTGSASPLSAVMGEKITLTAEPNAGYHFKEWQVTNPSSGLNIDEDNKFIMPDEDVVIKAVFEENAKAAHFISIINDGNGTGSASSVSAVQGEEITLTAIPNAGYHFREWQSVSGSALVTNNKFIMLDEDVVIKAVFEENAKAAHFISIINDGTGTGSASSVSAVQGEEITLTATPNAGYHFKEWQSVSGSALVTDNKFIMPDEDVVIKAVFEENAKAAHFISITNDGNGTGNASSASAAMGEEITLTAIPNAGYHFREWQSVSGSAIVTDNKFIMPDEDIIIKAVFEENAKAGYSIYIINDGNGTGNASSVSAVQGEEITLTAMPNTGYHFVEWQVISGSAIVFDNRFIMPDGDITIKAIFEKDMYAIAASPASTNFGIAAAGYDETPFVQTVVISNTGNQNIILMQPTCENYEISMLSRNVIEPGETAGFTIQPKMNLTAGIYDDMITITGSNGAITIVKVKFQVTVPTPGTGSISGTVIDDSLPEPGKLSGVTVSVKRGEEMLGTLKTDTDGAFSFINLPYGIYSLVAVKGDQIVTKIIIVSQVATNGDVILPKGMKNTEVITKSSTPPVAADGLNDLFVKTSPEQEKGVTSDDLNVVDQGGSVEIILIAERKEVHEHPEEVQKLQNAAGPDKKLGLLLDLTVLKEVTPSAGNTTTTTLTELPDMLKITIELLPELQGRTDLTVMRVHEGVAEVLPSDNNGREYFTIEGNYLILYVNKFSAYAIAYGEAESGDNTSGSNPNDGGTAGDNDTGNDNTADESDEDETAGNNGTDGDGTTDKSGEEETTEDTDTGSISDKTSEEESAEGHDTGSDSVTDKTGRDRTEDKTGRDRIEDKTGKDRTEDKTGKDKTEGKTGKDKTAGDNVSGSGKNNNTADVKTTEGNGTGDIISKAVDDKTGNGKAAGSKSVPDNTAAGKTIGGTTGDRNTGSNNTEGNPDNLEAQDGTIDAARANAMEQLTKKHDEAVSALYDLQSREQRQIVIDKIDRVFAEAKKAIESAESTEKINELYNKAVEAFGADQQVTEPAISVSEGKPFVLINFLLTLITICFAILALFRRSKRSRLLPAAGFAAASILLFIFTTGWDGIILADIRTAETAALTIISAWLFFRKNHRGNEADMEQ